MNVQLHHVISDITGATGLAILDAILGGERNPNALAKLRDRHIKASAETVAKSLVGITGRSTCSLCDSPWPLIATANSSSTTAIARSSGNWRTSIRRRILRACGRPGSRAHDDRPRRTWRTNMGASWEWT